MGDASPHRKRLKRLEAGGEPRFLTFSCHRRLPLLGRAAIRDVFSASLGAARARFGFELFAWVAMPEHAHLLIRPRAGEPVAPALRSLKLSVAERVLDRWRELDAPILKRITLASGGLRFWQKGGGFDRNVRDLEEFARHVRYIHRNPVKRGLVKRAEDWKWSSVRWWAGERANEVVCDPSPEGLNSWVGFR